MKAVFVIFFILCCSFRFSYAAFPVPKMFNGGDKVLGISSQAKIEQKQDKLISRLQRKMQGPHYGRSRVRHRDGDSAWLSILSLLAILASIFCFSNDGKAGSILYFSGILFTLAAGIMGYTALAQERKGRALAWTAFLVSVLVAIIVLIGAKPTLY